MGFVQPADAIIFADDKLESEFNSLPENDWLKKAIKRVIENFKNNAFCGDRIRKEIIPKEYIYNYGIDNLLWCPLPKGWRLVYSMATNTESKITVIIIEYFDHKNYERRFKY